MILENCAYCKVFKCNCKTKKYWICYKYYLNY